ncbi:MAG: hypothetical protein H7141_04000 [Burkholderiales bacterium]|nr:hypothetical protein [Bacteroidia bacterium]
MLKSKYIIHLFVFTYLSINAVAQHEISKYEIRWAVFHPLAAIKIKVRLKKAMVIYHEVKNTKQLDNFESGGNLDAFRHSFTMAYLAQRIRIRKLRKLGTAHEKGNKRQFEKHKTEHGERADSLACEMDLRNNELGFFIGCNNRKLSKEELRNIIIGQIKSGNAWCLKRNNNNEYVTCDNNPVLMENFREKWFVPKCLTKSNE